VRMIRIFLFPVYLVFISNFAVSQDSLHESFGSTGKKNLS